MGSPAADGDGAAGFAAAPPTSAPTTGGGSSTSSGSTGGAASTPGSGGSQQPPPPPQQPQQQERRGRFKIRQVDASSERAEEAAHGHAAPLSTSTSSSSSLTVLHGPPQRLPTTGDFSAVSDLTASDSGPKTGTGPGLPAAAEKKGRFIIRDLPEGSEVRLQGLVA